MAPRKARNSAPWATTSTTGGRAVQRLTAAMARAVRAGKLSAPSGVSSPSTQGWNHSPIGLPSMMPKATSRRPSSTCTGRLSWAAAMSAVTLARDSGEDMIVLMPRLRSIRQADRACASPVSFSGISTFPCDRFWVFQSVSPWRRNQKAMGWSWSAGALGMSSGQTFLLKGSLDRGAGEHAVEMGGAVGRQGHADALGPELGVEDCRIGDGERAQGVVLALQGLVEGGETLGGEFLSARLHRFLVSRARGEVGRAELTAEALHMDGRHGIVGQFQRACLLIDVIGQQFGRRVGLGEPVGDCGELGEHGPVVARQGGDFRLRVHVD